MYKPRNGLIAGSTLLLAAVLAGCSDTAVTSPTRAPGARSSVIVQTTTVWDFAAIGPSSDPGTDLGSSHAFTISGVGTITATSDATHHVTDKAEPGSERGLGLCDTSIDNPCGDQNDEVGRLENAGHLDLNFSALPAGTTVTQLTFGSVQLGEGVNYSISTDNGTTFGTPIQVIPPSPGVPNNLLTINFGTPLSTTGLVIRFTTATGAGIGADTDDDYTVNTVTTVNSVNVNPIWCSPGFWKTHPDAWPTSLQNQLYNSHSAVYLNDPTTFVGYDFGKKLGSSNPTLITVISHPNIYTGAATNNVASWISNQLFGTPIVANPSENCPDVLPNS